ncbi:MAG: nitrous oxide reductase family maturation protein NosD [Ardenticatenia bacterium]|nr:nitrous oxide reductase family maturation protein NosD [Ardenticatenia bacterium]
MSTHRIRFRWAVAFLLLGLWWVSAGARPADTRGPLVVSPDGPYVSIQEALAVASPGSTVEVRGGVYTGPLVVEKSVRLVGVDWPVIEGNGEGTVVKIVAPDVYFGGFVVRNSGDSLDEENSGIAVEAPRGVVEGNRLEETLFGIYLREATDTVVRGNVIESKALDVPRRGDPIRVWYSSGAVIENNVVRQGRDVILWYSEGLTVRGNRVEGGRYGLHFMYCDDALIEDNQLVNNSVGAFLMYSRRLHLRRNFIAYNRGPSGFGVGLKDMDDALVERNLLVDNRVGIFVDNSPREIDSVMTYTRNVIAYNDVGVQLQPSARRNRYEANSFVENQEQVHIAGGGQLRDNVWVENFWSDYAGYDADGDGIGDVAYRPQRLFEDLMGRYPPLQLFRYSPVAQALDFAAQAVPLVRPQPKLQDRAPRMVPVVPSGVPAPEGRPHVIFGLGMVALVLGGVALVGWGGRVGGRVGSRRGLVVASVLGERGREMQEDVNMDPMVRVRALTKRFGHFVAVRDVDFDVARGEAVALWGANGAGKTTILRCLLGLYPFEGDVVVGGYHARWQGREVRRLVGFVPQELSFHDDLSVEETLCFYARLRKTTPALSSDWVERLGLEELAGRIVGELSGGMKQRLALAVALLGDPPILFLDEPTANLDVRSRREFFELLQQLRGAGKTILFSSHRFDEVAALADRVLVVEGGRVVSGGALEDLAAVLEDGVVVRLAVAPGQVEEAVRVLRKLGLEAERNGTGVWVRVPSCRKVEPIVALAGAGVLVYDFALEPYASVSVGG